LSRVAIDTNVCIFLAAASFRVDVVAIGSAQEIVLFRRYLESMTLEQARDLIQASMRGLTFFLVGLQHDLLNLVPIAVIDSIEHVKFGALDVDLQQIDAVNLLRTDNF